MIKYFTKALSQKEKSIKELYQLIKEHRSLSKNDLMTYTGIAPTTCSRLIDEMLHSQLIMESGYGESSGGRKPILYNIRPDIYHLIGIDISRSHTKILLLDLDLNIKSEASLPMNETTNPEITIHFIVTTINQMLKEEGMEKQDILGIGIGAIGPLDREKGMIIDPIDFPTQDWNNVKIVDILEEKLGIKTLINYGVNTAILAEIENHEFKKYKNIIYIIKGVGTRISLMMDRIPIQGSDNFSMFNHGHMIVNTNGRKCNVCGNNGCVEAYSSISSLQQEVLSQLQQGSESILQSQYKEGKEIDFYDICHAVNHNDPLSTEIVKEAAYFTGIEIANISNLIHPELIILNGPTYTHMDLFYETAIQAYYDCNKLNTSENQVIFTRGLFGNNAAAIGAANMVFNYYLS